MPYFSAFRPAAWRLALGLLITLAPGGVLAQPTITGLSPARNLRNAPAGSNVALTFSQPMGSGSATLNAGRVFSAQ
ncbi:MAG: hypothetical protein H7330_08175, partial [Hymenobacteraceae bacterium]|nr:hypothetical protein [Hymenobacteraceae bacterium]